MEVAYTKGLHELGDGLYTYLQPEVIRAIAAEAHRQGMTVTGHVPQVFNGQVP